MLLANVECAVKGMIWYIVATESKIRHHTNGSILMQTSLNIIVTKLETYCVFVLLP